MKILIIILGAHGSIVRTTPITYAIKQKYPKGEIYFLTKISCRDILLHNPYIDHILLWEKDLEETKKKEFDWVISLEDELEAVKFATELKAKKLTGSFYQDNAMTYTEESAPWFDMGLISKFGIKEADKLKIINKKTYQQLLFEMLDLPLSDDRIILNLSAGEKSFGEHFLYSHSLTHDRTIVGLNTGAGSRWGALKSLSIDKTVELARQLNEEGYSVVLLGGPEETLRNKEIFERTKTFMIDAGTSHSIRDFMSLINVLDILITSDSFALHLGAGLKKYVVCFFGPTPAEEIELYGRGVKLIPDSPCYKCYKTKRDKPEMCIDKITVADIMQAVRNSGLASLKRKVSRSQ